MADLVIERVSLCVSLMAFAKQVQYPQVFLQAQRGGAIRPQPTRCPDHTPIYSLHLFKNGWSVCEVGLFYKGYRWRF